MQATMIQNTNNRRSYIFNLIENTVHSSARVKIGFLKKMLEKIAKVKNSVLSVLEVVLLHESCFNYQMPLVAPVIGRPI